MTFKVSLDRFGEQIVTPGGEDAPRGIAGTPG
jgi:hypothetical protein